MIDKILGNVRNEAADVLGKPSQSAASKSFNKDFTDSSFDSFGGSVDSDQYYEIARFVVPASTRYAWGYGSAKNPDNQGYLYVDLQNDSPSAVEGALQLVQTSPTERQEIVVAEYDTTTLDGSKNNRRQKVPLPEQVQVPLVGQDSILLVRLKATGSDTVDQTESDVIFPVTEYDLS